MELDRISKHVLVKLAQLDEATASELKDALGLEQNQSIHYRMDEKLIPQKLVLEYPERREQPGSRKAARVYQITDTGNDWVDKHGHEITLSDLDEAEQEIQRITAELRSVSSDIQKLKSWRQEQSGHAGGVSTRLSTLGDRVDDLDERMQMHDRRDYSGIWDQLHDLNDRTDKLDDELDSLASERQLQQETSELKSNIESIESRQKSTEDSLQEFAEWSRPVDQRLRRLEKHATQGFLGRLRWLLFG